MAQCYVRVSYASVAMSGSGQINPNLLDPGGRFKPPSDEIFDTLFALAIQGDLNVYYGAVPLGLVRPFSDTFKFAQLPGGAQIIDSIISEALRGNFAKLWVYEKDGVFIMSDDYATYEASLQGQPDYVPCWVLGKPRNPLVKHVQGPVDARDAAGFAS